MADRVRRTEGWVRALHEVVFAERPVRTANGVITSSPLDAQVVLIAPGGTTALLTACWHGRTEPVDGAAFAEGVQAALSDLTGIGVRCLQTQGPPGTDVEGAWSEGDSGSIGLVHAPSWLAAMGTPPVAAGTVVSLDVVLEGWPGSGSGTLVMDGEFTAEVTTEWDAFTASGRLDAASFVLRVSGCEVAPRVPRARFDGRVLGVRRGAWSMEVSGDGTLVHGGPVRGTVRWVTDGTRVAIRVDPEAVPAPSGSVASSGDTAETVVIDREALRDVLRGRGAVAIDEPR